MVLGMTFHNVVEQLAVVCGDVFDVAEVFEASFDFERGDAGFDHGAEVGGCGEVFEGEEVLCFADRGAVGAAEVVG